MRAVATSLIVAGLLLIGAPSAHAFAVNMIERNGVVSVSPGDSVIVDVFLDADPGLQFFGIGVLYDDPGFTYDPSASAALPIIYPGSYSSGAQPNYILYDPGNFMVPFTILYPQQTPYFSNWPVPPAGQGQVNIDFVEASFSSASASGNDIWIASLVFDVDGFGGTIALSVTAGGNAIAANGVQVDPATVALSAPLVFVPEPGTAPLIGLGIGGLAIAARRRRA